MAKRILQIDSKTPESMEMNSPEGHQMIKEWVQAVAQFPGLAWKIWLKNEESGEYGGIYLFDDEQSLQEYLESESVARVKQMPDVSVKKFEIEDELTEKTDGPIK